MLGKKTAVPDEIYEVSALQFGGKPNQLLGLAADGHIDLAISEAIVEEALRVPSDGFHRHRLRRKATRRSVSTAL